MQKELLLDKEDSVKIEVVELPGYKIVVCYEELKLAILEKLKKETIEALNARRYAAAKKEETLQAAAFTTSA